MSFFKSRSGGSLFRIRALSGFLGFLSKNKNNNETSKVNNKMSLKFTIKEK